MQETVPVGPSLPRPGRTMRIVLATLGVVWLLGAVIHNWLPGPPAGPEILRLFLFEPDGLAKLHLWTFLTSGVVTSPVGLGHVFFSLLGLYFFTPSLEKSWGGARLVRLLLLAVVVGNLTVLLVDRLVPGGNGLFHPAATFGPGSALTAVLIAWSREHRNATARLFFLLPVSGRVIFWFTVGLAVLGIVAAQPVPEGAVAPFGGIAVGLAMGGHPSPARALWLRIKLAFLRRRGSALTVESILEDAPRQRPAKRTSSRKGGPTLHVVQGGLEDELKNRKPPKDKRYLN